MNIDNYRSGIMSVNEISTVVVTVHLKAKYADQIIDGKFRYLRVWKLFDNSWKIITGSGFQI